MQLTGIVLTAGSLVLLSGRLAGRAASGWAAPCRAGATAGIALTGALRAVDGVALRNVVNRWAATADPGKAVVFEAAFAVRQIEIGLAVVSSLIFGPTISVYGIAILADGRRSKWLGAMALLAGLPTVFSGLAIAYTRYSGLEMSVTMPSGMLLILWVFVLSVGGLTGRWRLTAPQRPD